MIISGLCCTVVVVEDTPRRTTINILKLVEGGEYVMDRELCKGGAR